MPEVKLPKITRPYKGSRSWALFSRREEIPDSSQPDRVYLRRWRIVQTPLFALYLHQIFVADGDREPHNHPFNFTSLVLKGGYSEWVQDLHGDVGATLFHKQWSFHRMTMEAYHRIIKLVDVPTWTLVFIGKRHPEWGFATDQGYIPSRDYFTFREERAVFERRLRDAITDHADADIESILPSSPYEAHVLTADDLYAAIEQITGPPTQAELDEMERRRAVYASIPDGITKSPVLSEVERRRVSLVMAQLHGPINPSDAIFLQEACARHETYLEQQS